MTIKRYITVFVAGGLTAALALAVGLLWFGGTLPLSRKSGGYDPALAVVIPLPGRAAVDNTAAAEITAVAPSRQPQTPMSEGPVPPPNPGRPEKAVDAPAAPVANAPPVSTRPKRHPREPGRLAIVIDDLGHNLYQPRRLLALDQPLTFSILSARPHSSEVMNMVRRAGRDFLVHLPMEPLAFPRDNPGPRALLLSMDAQATRKLVRAHLESLPGAVGANNHMGSAYTDDLAKMRIVQELVAEHGLLFLNSKTTASPVPARIARDGGYPYLERDVFLDNERDVGAIGRQLARAVQRAKERGRAIAIGHPYSETVRVLRERLPRLHEHGVLLVPISQL